MLWQNKIRWFPCRFPVQQKHVNRVVASRAGQRGPADPDGTSRPYMSFLFKNPSLGHPAVPIFGQTPDIAILISVDEIHHQISVKWLVKISKTICHVSYY